MLSLIVDCLGGCICQKAQLLRMEEFQIWCCWWQCGPMLVNETEQFKSASFLAPIPKLPAFPPLYNLERQSPGEQKHACCHLPLQVTPGALLLEVTYSHY